MANRVVYGALPGGGYGLRVSRLGFNVLDPGLTGQQLSFDSRWPRAARVHLTGGLSIAQNTGDRVVGLGRVFAIPPPALIISYAEGGFDTPGWASTDSIWKGGWNQAVQPIIPHARIFTDRIEFTGSQFRDRHFKYIVMSPF